MEGQEYSEIGYVATEIRVLVIRHILPPFSIRRSCRGFCGLDVRFSDLVPSQGTKSARICGNLDQTLQLSEIIQETRGQINTDV